MHINPHNQGRNHVRTGGGGQAPPRGDKCLICQHFELFSLEIVFGWTFLGFIFSDIAFFSKAPTRFPSTTTFSQIPKTH